MILMTNNSLEPLVIKTGQRIAQIVFHKKKLFLKKMIVSVEQKEDLEGVVQQGFNLL